MPNPEVSFRSYLHEEVNKAEARYERARAMFFAVSEGPVPQPTPVLLEATEDVSEALRLYCGALRRLANYSAHKIRQTQQREELATHA